MKKLYSIVPAVLFVFASVHAQTNSATLTSDTLPIQQPEIKQHKTQDVYKMNWGADIPVTATGTLWSLYAFSQIYSKDPTDAETVLALDRSQVPRFDRWGIRPYNEKVDKISYLPFYASMPMPVFFLFDKKMRKDIAKLSFLYLEAMSVTGLLYTGSTYFIDRYRPYVWDEKTDLDYRTRGGGRNSFYAGHVALVATSTFFFAQVWADYHPDSKAKWVWYGLAGAATGATAYWRHRGGLHFPSDILLGITQGTLTGILVPKLHKTKLIKNQNLSITPFTGLSHGLAVRYKL
ncbi:MAG TPA: phosphatase PAP2 family protein [Niastella sp.]|nr:phosphatase PAP2 family protein [Niastella sp.]